MVFVNDLLCPRPPGWITDWLRVLPANLRQPLRDVGVIKSPGIQRAKRVAAHPVVVLQHEREFRLEFQVGADKNVAEHSGIIEQMRGIPAVVTGAQTNLVSGINIARFTAADLKRSGYHAVGVGPEAVRGSGPVHPSAAGVAVPPPARRGRFSDADPGKQTPPLCHGSFAASARNGRATALPRAIPRRAGTGRRAVRDSSASSSCRSAR